MIISDKNIRLFLIFLRFVTAVLLPPILTLCSIFVFTFLEKKGYHTPLPHFTDQAFFSMYAFYLGLVTLGVGGSMLSGFLIFLTYELYFLRRYKLTKFQAYIIIQLLGIIIYLACILLVKAIWFLHPVYYIPVLLTTHITTYVYLKLYGINHVFRH